MVIQNYEISIQIKYKYELLFYGKHNQTSIQTISSNFSSPILSLIWFSKFNTHLFHTSILNYQNWESLLLNMNMLSEIYSFKKFNYLTKKISNFKSQYLLAQPEIITCGYATNPRRNMKLSFWKRKRIVFFK